MYRLGLRLTLRSGREPFVRLLVTAAAVAVGVAIMLAVLADFHAFRVTSYLPSGRHRWLRLTSPCRPVELQQRPLQGPDHRAAGHRLARVALPCPSRHLA